MPFALMPLGAAVPCAPARGRVQGWEARLAGVLERARGRPYVLGESDCFRMACEAVEALTGLDPWPEFAGRYATRREALALIAQWGPSFDIAFSKFFGVEPSPMGHARRGDVVKFVQGDAHLGVCNGASVAVVTEPGLLFVRLSDCELAWRIG